MAAYHHTPLPICPCGRRIAAHCPDASLGGCRLRQTTDDAMKNPIQPLTPDAEGVMRFKANRIVQHLLDTHPTCGLNQIACMDFSDDDRQQFAQLIGYSLSGYGDLSGYVDDEAYSTAANMADGLDARDARIAALEQKLSEMRAAVDQLREPVARLLEMHPDDLKG